MEWNIVDMENGISMMTLSGRMDVAGALKIDPVFTAAAGEKSNLIVDVSGVTFLASLGIRTLVVTCKALAEKGGNMVLLSPQPGVEKVLKTSGISTIIPVVSDLASATALFST